MVLRTSPSSMAPKSSLSLSPPQLGGMAGPPTLSYSRKSRVSSCLVRTIARRDPTVVYLAHLTTAGTSQLFESFVKIRCHPSPMLGIASSAARMATPLLFKLRVAEGRLS